MQYHHIYHAGNFADVFKHCVLIAAIKFLIKKEKPFFYLDTHAGAGRYDLNSAPSQKTCEFENGILKLKAAKKDVPEIVQTYLHIQSSALVTDYREQYDCALDASFRWQEVNNKNEYLGSPCIVRAMLRSQDRMCLIEKQMEELAILRQEFIGDRRVAIHKADSYQALKAFLPPKIGRGFTLIDPPFEAKSEFQKICGALKLAWPRFSSGIYAVWYPMKELNSIKDFYREIAAIGFKNILIMEFNGGISDVASGMTKCGMLIINAPWQFDREITPVLAYLAKVLGGSSATPNIFWLTS